MSWTYRDDEQAASNPIGGYRAVVLTDQAFANATGGTAAAITGLSFPIKASQTWVVRLLVLTTGVSGGGKFSVSGPASPATVKLTAKGLVGGITAFSTDTVTALDTLGAAYNTTAVSGHVELTCVFANGSTAGTVSFNCANVTNSNSFAVLAGSIMIATRIA